ncbi:hypothetical protein [Nocardioides montaniterrae]
MNADEARDRAVNALANRFRAFGATDPAIRAHEYIGGLMAEGWTWQPTENRPVPPKRDDECQQHAGQWAGRCAGCAADQLEAATAKRAQRTPPPKVPKPPLPRVHPQPIRELLPSPHDTTTEENR